MDSIEETMHLYKYTFLLLLAVALAGCQSSIRFATHSTSAEKETTGEQHERALPSNAFEAKVLDVAESWIGTPYRYSGTDHEGIDCSALMVNIFSSVNIQLPRTSGEQFYTGYEVPLSGLAIGDLVFFNLNGRGVSHVGMYAGNDEFIHASLSAGVIRESLSQPYYSNACLGARRVVPEHKRASK